MDISLDPMTEEEFNLFLKRAIPHYAEENAKAGYWTQEESLERSAAEIHKLLPEGPSTKDNFLLTIHDYEGKFKVGSVWLRADRSATRQTGFIYDIVIDDHLRGKGYGTRTMRAIEKKAKELGLKTLALHVFSSNTAALHLYEKEGYLVKSMNMTKDI